MTALAAVSALAASMVIGADPSAGAAAGARAAAPAVPGYYLALPGGDNFANVPGSRTAVVDDTLTGKRLLTVRAFGTDKSRCWARTRGRARRR